MTRHRMTAMSRLAIVILVLLFGWILGGWTGVLCFGLLLGFIGALIGPPKPREGRTEAYSGQETWEWEKVDRARRGSDNDPTRPDDHPLLLTHEIRRRR